MTAPTSVRLDSGKNKSVGTAYALWLLLGIFGGHWFYLGRPGRGVLYFFTLGGFLIGWIVDLFTLPNHVRRINVFGL
jgi:TM2 domain-containing membrane protein YozV